MVNSGASKGIALRMEVLRIVACLGGAALLATTSWATYPELISASLGYASLCGMALFLHRSGMAAPAPDSKLMT